MAGGNRPEIGSFRGGRVQARLEPFTTYVPKFAGGATLKDRRVVFVEVFLFNMKMRAPSSEDVGAWGKHFKLSRQANWVGLAGDTWLLKDGSRLVPGFLLLDRKQKVVSDCTGRNQAKVYTELLPMLGRMLGKIKGK